MSGGAFGAGASGNDAKDGGTIGALIGFNTGLAAGGVMAALGYVPSYKQQKWMWAGYGAGAAASSVVYFFYIGSDRDPKRRLIANSIGALAGLTIAGILTSNMKDDEDKKAVFTPPFQLGVSPLSGGGGMLTASGLLQ